MPLVRVQVRSEYGLGQKELYGQAVREDPKALLEGVTVTGLVGILRQLGDLAEFAAEIFHGLQEQVMETACRSRKLTVRVQNVEAALPSIEKAVLAQTSHIHFAYTAGCEWHPRLRTEQNHLIGHDLPCFIMDSYEECHDPPRLHFLDKFDVGGPGSCLKRYSDPTFFKTSSASSEKAYPSKVQRNKKAHKTRRKRSLHQNDQGLHGLSVSDLSGRMQFSSIKGQASPTQSASTVDMTGRKGPEDDRNSWYSKRDMTGRKGPVDEASPAESASTVDMTGRKGPEDDLNSWYSKRESMYLELLHLNSEQPEADVQDSGESPALMPLGLGNAQDSASTHEQIRTNDGEFLEKEDIVIDPSCVVWDEKAQILELETAGACSGVTFEMFFTKSNLIVQEIGAVNLQNDCETDVLFVGSNVHQLPSDRNQIYEAEIEPDNYVDALNTIESENDFVFTTKQEVGPYTSNGSYDTDQTHDVNAPGSNCHSPKLGSYPESCVTSDKETVLDLPEAISPEQYTHEQKLENSRDFYSGNHSQGACFENDFDTVDDAKIRSATLDDDKIYGSNDPLVDNLTSRFLEPEELSAKLSSCNSSKLWTNGTLFGLEPSKPPDFAAPNVVRQPSGKASETALPVAPNDISSSPKFTQKNDESSSQLFGLGNELFVSGFQRMNLSHDENFEHLSSLKAPVLKQRGESRRGTYQTLPEMTVDRQFDLDSPLVSLPSSPRLEHINISFHPINVFETPQLKLNFPCIQSYESIGTTFPSFQLVSEQTSFVDEICLDSDYDTFCRSSPYMSDDCLSNVSDSSSNQWESREYPQSEELDLYDGLDGVSPIESVPSFVDLGGMINTAVGMDAGIRSAHTGNNTEPSYFDHCLDLQSSNSMREEQHDSDPINLLNLQVPLESTSLAPPLPPAHWRLIKTFSDLTENRRNIDPTRGPNISKEEHINGASAVNPLHKVKLNLNGENKANWRGEGKGKEESESFLQQIRSKSFSLRRTVSETSTSIPMHHGPNVKVTAILEKASAIRQAVGGVHGNEDETWSDS